MTAIELNNLDDLVFQHRNKAYGAYQLRKNQNKNFAIAMTIVFGSIAFAWSVQAIIDFFYVPVPQEIFHPVPDEYPLPDWKEPSPPVFENSGAAKAHATTSAIPWAIVDSVHTVSTATFHSQDFDFGIENAVGIETGSENGTGILGGDGNENAQSGILGGEEETAHEPMQIIEFASFPGGEEQLEAFVERNFDFPQHTLEETSGVLVLYFEIDELGKTKNVKVIKGFPGSEKFEKEAIRVLNSMPDWSPKKINGKPVMTRRELKINCKL